MRKFGTKTVILVSGILLSLTTAPVAEAASCGTVASPTTCAITVGNITYTTSGFTLVNSAGTVNVYQAADISIDIATGGGNTLLMTFTKNPLGPTPGVVFLTNPGETSNFLVTYNVALTPAAPGTVAFANPVTGNQSSTTLNNGTASVQYTVPSAGTCLSFGGSPTCNFNMAPLPTTTLLIGNSVGLAGLTGNASILSYSTLFNATFTAAPPQPPTVTKVITADTLTVNGTTQMTITLTNPNAFPLVGVAITDVFPTGLVPSAVGGTCLPVLVGQTISVSGVTLPAAPGPGNQCTISATVTANGAAFGSITNTTGTVTSADPVTVGGTASDTVTVLSSGFLIRYSANLNIGESVVNFTNTGESSTTSFGPALAQNGDICANVFAYSPDEQLVSCCSCNVTPNALNSLSVKADLGTNTLTPIIPSALVIKVVATLGGQACTAASAASVNTAALQSGLAAWGTSLTALPVTPGTPAGTYGVVETPFSLATISPAELTRMSQLCAFIRANGSGYGICKSCKVGGLGASAR